MVSPKRMESFWEVSVAILWGESGRKGLGDPHIHHFVNEFLRIQDTGIYHYGKSFFVTDDFHHIFQ